MMIIGCKKSDLSVNNYYNTLYIFITQSGETSDTIKCTQKVKENSNLATLCITNNE